MNRRRLLSWGLALPSLSFGQDASSVGKKTYAEDLDFLLAEIPKKAGHFFELKKIDWNGVSAEFRSAITTIKDDGDFALLCSRLLARLKDGHASIVDFKGKWPDKAKGRRFTGPRVHLLTTGEDVFVRVAFKSAEEAGLKSGQQVVKIDGKPAVEWLKAKVVELRNEQGYSTDHQALFAACHWGLASWEGEPITFTIKTPEGAEKEIRLIRSGGPNYAPIGPLFPPSNSQASGRNIFGKTAKGTGYIHLRTIPGSLDKDLDTMLRSIGPVKGLILDMRGNGGGGCDHSAVFSRFLPKGEIYDSFEGKGESPHTGRMVVIIDSGVRSAGETVAGMFKETRRAWVIGDGPTAGMSSSKARLTVPSGLLTAYFSISSNMGRYNKGRGIEGIGIAPHTLIAYDPADLLKDEDTLIKAAEMALEAPQQNEEVDYLPPSERKEKK